MGILDNYLKIEENNELFKYSFTFKNILMYPFIRHKLLQSTIEEITNLPISYNNRYKKEKIINRLTCVLKSFIYQPKKNINAKIVYFGEDFKNILIGNSYFNRVTEYFANEYPQDTIIYEASFNRNYKRPRTYPKVYAFDIINIISKIKSLFYKIKNEDNKQIDNFIRFLKDNYQHNFNNLFFWGKIKKTLYEYAVKLPFLYKEYKNLLKKHKPKIIFSECLLYGSSYIPLIMAAKDLNIPIAEYQHGLISLTHTAYNYSSNLPEIYKYYLPDFFMCYGKYWNKNSRIPVEIHLIGNPFLSETLSSINKKTIIKDNIVLYVFLPELPEKSVKELLHLHSILSPRGYKIIFRVHPLDIDRLQKYFEPIFNFGIEIDTQPLYETLKKTKFVVGSTFSTVFFEASSFDCIVLIIETVSNKNYIDFSYFNKCTSINDACEKIINNEYTQSNSDDFWEDNWRENYRSLIDSYIKL